MSRTHLALDQFALDVKGIATKLAEHDTALDTAEGHAAASGTPTVALAAQVSTHRDATVQLKDDTGTALAEKAVAMVWLSDAAGGAPTASAPDGGVAVQTGTSIAVVTAGKVLQVMSDAAGAIVVRLTHAGADTTWYVNVAFGAHIASSAALLIDN